MLFEFKDNDLYDLNLDYFNLNKMDKINYGMDSNINLDKKYYMQNKMNSDLNLENGFYLGNLFSDLYDPYKSYKPKKIVGYSEQQKMLLKLQELDFIINDLNLYLDLNPNDKKVYEIFKTKALEYDALKKKYYEKYQVLELCKDTKEKYTWIDNPWPWDGGYYV